MNSSRPCKWLGVALILCIPATVHAKGRRAPAEKKPDLSSQNRVIPSSAAAAQPVEADTAPAPAVPQAEMPPQQAAQEPPNAVPEGSRIHKVWVWQETRDCLWQLAKQYYGDPWQWKKIYLANRNNIPDPAVIFPKQEIVIPPREQGGQ